MNLVQVRLETAPLREFAVAFAALERTHTCVGSCVSLQVERVVEALLTERAQVALDVAVVLHVTVHESLQFERLLADLTFVFVLRIVDDFHR